MHLDLIGPDHCNRAIHAHYYAPDQVIPGTFVGFDQLKSLRLDLISLLCQTMYDLKHRKEYKAVPTDKSG